jgi:hypothetical protein
MSGRPAETWKKFNFATPPDWAYALLILVCLGGVGVIAFAVVVALISQRASGYLPLTRSSARTATLAFWVPIGILIAWAVCWLSWIVVAVLSVNDPNASGLAAVFFLVGAVCLFLGLLTRLIITPLVSPRAKVLPIAPGYSDRIVELRNVHPAFVAAVQQRQQARAAQYAPAPQSQLPPSHG